MIGKGNYRLFVTDPEAGQVTFIGTIREEGNTTEGTASPIALRLKVKNQQITEIETLVIRPAAQLGGGGARGAGAALPRCRRGRPQTLKRWVLPIIFLPDYPAGRADVPGGSDPGRRHVLPGYGEK